jgi:hypothetical protein
LDRDHFAIESRIARDSSCVGNGAGLISCSEY